MAFSALTQSTDIEDADGHEDPFATFSWGHWLAMQTKMILQFARFQRAISRRDGKLSLLIAFEMEEMVEQWKREACEWISSPEIE